jgi:flagellar transcriptional activator FlhD
MNNGNTLKWDVKSEVQESNLNYLILAQKMIKLDKHSAMYRLGVSESIADLIGSFSTLQLIKLASASVLLMRFRFDDEKVLGIVSQNRTPFELSSIHSTILLSNQIPETIL